MPKSNLSRISERFTQPCLMSTPDGTKLRLQPDAMVVGVDGSGYLDPFATPVPENESDTGKIIVEKRRIERGEKGYARSVYIVDLTNIVAYVWPPEPRVPQSSGTDWFPVYEFIPAREAEPEADAS